MKIYEGNLIAKDKKFGIIVSRFNEFITKKLLEGALDALTRHGTDEKNVEIFWVPGSFEIPLIAKKLAQSKKYNSLIALGCVIQGDTPHYEYIAAEVTKGIAQSSLQTGIPIAFGVLTTDTIEQAIERAGTKEGNKGFQAAMSAIEMANLIEAM